jgi:hypothetical protein
MITNKFVSLCGLFIKAFVNFFSVWTLTNFVRTLLNEGSWGFLLAKRKFSAIIKYPCLVVWSPNSFKHACDHSDSHNLSVILSFVYVIVWHQAAHSAQRVYLPIIQRQINNVVQVITSRVGRPSKLTIDYSSLQRWLLPDWRVSIPACHARS